MSDENKTYDVSIIETREVNGKMSERSLCKIVESGELPFVTLVDGLFNNSKIAAGFPADNSNGYRFISEQGNWTYRSYGGYSDASIIRQATEEEIEINKALEDLRQLHFKHTLKGKEPNELY